MKSIFYTLLGIACVVYLLMPSVLPDTIPIVGAIDEVTATLLLLRCLKHFGIDLSFMQFKKKK